MKFISCACLSIALLLSACSPVQPWQKGNLAKSHMSFEPAALEARQRQHIYFSKEGTNGGYGVGGGGCGCN
ncbi:MAG: DUF4266 domain-containing protein [bacterium]|nr:DUF4266 domain-containing protein [bacterium]